MLANLAPTVPPLTVRSATIGLAVIALCAAAPRSALPQVGTPLNTPVSDVTPPEVTLPTAGAEPAPTGGAGAQGGDACARALNALGGGDMTALKALPAAQRDALLGDGRTVELLACLAVAEQKTSSCDALPSAGKKTCMDRYRFVRELKDMPPGALKAQVLYTTCVGEAPKADCEKARDAIAKRDPALCKQLSTEGGPWGRGGICDALASGDPKFCEGAPEAAQRATCAAMATDDPSRCPKDATDCIKVVGNFAAMKAGGIQAADINDRAMLALSKGKSACAPLASELADACSAGSGTPAAGTPAAAGSTPGRP